MTSPRLLFTIVAAAIMYMVGLTLALTSSKQGGLDVMVVATCYGLGSLYFLDIKKIRDK